MPMAMRSSASRREHTPLLEINLLRRINPSFGTVSASKATGRDCRCLSSRDSINDFRSLGLVRACLSANCEVPFGILFWTASDSLENDRGCLSVKSFGFLSGSGDRSPVEFFAGQSFFKKGLPFSVRGLLKDFRSEKLLSFLVLENSLPDPESTLPRVFFLKDFPLSAEDRVGPEVVLNRLLRAMVIHKLGTKGLERK